MPLRSGLISQCRLRNKHCKQPKPPSFQNFSFHIATSFIHDVLHRHRRQSLVKDSISLYILSAVGGQRTPSRTYGAEKREGLAHSTKLMSLWDNHLPQTNYKFIKKT